MRLDTKIQLEEELSSKLVRNGKISMKSPHIGWATIPLVLAGIIGCYRHYVPDKPIENPPVTKPAIVETPRLIEPDFDEKPSEPVLNHPFIMESDNPAKKEIFNLVQRAVADLDTDKNIVPLVMSVVDAETKFIADVDKSDGPEKSLCKLISTRGAAGHMQLMTAAIPSEEPYLTKAKLRKLVDPKYRYKSYSKMLKEYCMSVPRKELIAHDVRFDPYQNIKHGVRVLSTCTRKFRPGSHGLYTFSKERSTLGDKYNGTPPSKAESTHTITVATQRESQALGLACYNTGLSNAIVSLVRKRSSGDHLTAINGAVAGYARHVLSMTYPYSRSMKKNPEYSVPPQRRVDARTREKQWRQYSKTIPRS